MNSQKNLFATSQLSKINHKSTKSPTKTPSKPISKPSKTTKKTLPEPIIIFKSKITNNRNWFDIVKDGAGGYAGRIQTKMGPFVSINLTNYNNLPGLYIIYYDLTNQNLRIGRGRDPNMTHYNFADNYQVIDMIQFSYNYLVTNSCCFPNTAFK